MKNNKRFWTGLVVCVALAAAFLLLFDFPRKISATYPAVEYDENGKYIVTSVSVDGTYRTPLLRDPSFRGKIVCGEYDFTKELELADIHFDRNFGGMGILTYAGYRNGAAITRGFGTIKVSGNFDKLAINIVNGDILKERQAETLILCAPAGNLAEARKIGESGLGKIGPVSNVGASSVRTGGVGSNPAYSSASYVIRLNQVASDVSLREGTGKDGTLVVAAKDIAGFYAENSRENHTEELVLQFTERGKKAMAEATERLSKSGGSISLWAGETKLRSASVFAPITGGSAAFTESDAEQTKKDCVMLSSGHPVEIQSRSRK